MMGLINDTSQDELLLRQLFYGEPKTKKTWFAGLFAELGFNIFLLNGDDQGYQILRKLSPEAQKRIFMMNASDKFGNPMFSSVVTMMMMGQRIIWNDTKRIAAIMSKADWVDDEVYEIDIKKLDSNSILVLDSWTALCDSCTATIAQDEGINFLRGNKEDKGWDYYGVIGRILDEVLSRIKNIPGHAIVICHEQLDEKRDKEGKITDTKIIPVSSSRNHGKKLPHNFSDILHFVLSGTNNFIECTASDKQSGGTRTIPPGRYAWNKKIAAAEALTPEFIIKHLGVEPPMNDVPFPAIRLLSQEEKEKVVVKKAPQPLSSMPTAPKTLVTLGKK